MKFTYMKTPLHRFTFSKPKIRAWVEENVEGRVLNLFAGVTKLSCDEVRVDLNPEAPADHHIDALEFVKTMEDKFGYNPHDFGTFLLDPPYAYRKSMEKYDGFVASPFNMLKNAIAEVIRPGAIVITFGYHSVSMGEKRRFVQDHLLVMYHGGAIHDTLAIVERYSPSETAKISKLEQKRQHEFDKLLKHAQNCKTGTKDFL